MTQDWLSSLWIQLTEFKDALKVNFEKYTLLKISQLNYGQCPVAKFLGNSRKKMFEPLVKRLFAVN